MNKQQVRMMGLALILSFAVIRTMGGATTIPFGNTESYSPLSSLFTSSR